MARDIGDDASSGLPPGTAAAWGLRERPAKGPKRGLTLRRIIDAAVRLAASDGLPAVSMGRVAKELGVSTMSLYRYVESKDELLTLMVDAAGHTPPDPPAPDEDWRAALDRWAREYRAMLQRNLWVLRVPVGGPPSTPNQILWMERGLSCLRDTGLPEHAKVSVILLVSGFVRSEATLTADIMASMESSATAREIMTSYGRLLATVTDAERFPSVHAALEAGVFDDEDDDRDYDFVFGLERLLDGIGVLVKGDTSHE